jgi:uncharacterized GH25 family protein
MKALHAVLLTSFTLLLWVSRAEAHDLVLIPASPNALIIKFGHPGKYHIPNPEKLLQLNAYLADNAAPVSVLNGFRGSSADSATVDLTNLTKNHAVLIVAGQYDNGYFSNSRNQYFNTSKIHLPGAQDSGSFFKFGKALFPASGSGAYGRKLGEQLEIVPMTDPFKIQPGQKLPVKVWYDGKPLVNAGVEIGDGQTQLAEKDIPRYQTGAAGIASVPITKPGLQIIAVDYQTRPRFPALSDHDDYSATLAFVVAEHQLHGQP